MTNCVYCKTLLPQGGTICRYCEEMKASGHEWKSCPKKRKQIWVTAECGECDSSATCDVYASDN